MTVYSKVVGHHFTSDRTRRLTDALLLQAAWHLSRAPQTQRRQESEQVGAFVATSDRGAPPPPRPRPRPRPHPCHQLP